MAISNGFLVPGIPARSRTKAYSQKRLFKTKPSTLPKKAAKPAAAPAPTTKTVGGAKNGGKRVVAAAKVHLPFFYSVLSLCHL